MNNFEKILDIVEKTDKELVLCRENGDCYVIMKLENYQKISQKEQVFMNKEEDDYALSVKKIIMP